MFNYQWKTAYTIQVVILLILSGLYFFCDNILFSKDLYVIPINKKQVKKINEENKVSIDEEKTDRSKDGNSQSISIMSSDFKNQNLKINSAKDSNTSDEKDQTDLDESFFVEQSKDKKDSSTKKVCDIIVQPVRLF